MVSVVKGPAGSNFQGPNFFVGVTDLGIQTDAAKAMRCLCGQDDCLRLRLHSLDCRNGNSHERRQRQVAKRNEPIDTERTGLRDLSGRRGESPAASQPQCIVAAARPVD